MRAEAIRGIINSHYRLIAKLEDILKDMPVKKREFIAPDDVIVQLVNQVFKTDIQVTGREKRKVYARHCAVYLLRNHTTMIWKEIAYKTGNSDHSTALNSYKTFLDLMFSDEEYVAKVNEVKKLLEENKI